MTTTKQSFFADAFTNYLEPSTFVSQGCVVVWTELVFSIHQILVLLLKKKLKKALCHKSVFVFPKPPCPSRRLTPIGSFSFMPILQSHSIFNLLYTPTIFNYDADFKTHWNVHSTCAPDFPLTLDPWLLNGGDFHPHFVSCLKKTQEKPGLAHISCPRWQFL